VGESTTLKIDNELIGGKFQKSNPNPKNPITNSQKSKFRTLHFQISKSTDFQIEQIFKSHFANKKIELIMQNLNVFITFTTQSILYLCNFYFLEEQAFVFYF
jgi:hypothetical protein